MILDFQQGIVLYPSVGNTQTFLQFSNGYVSLSTANGHTDVAFAHGDSDYLLSETTSVQNAWGPLPANTDCWLFWDIDAITGQRTFGHTTLPPVHGGVQPAPSTGQHWFDLGTRKMYVCTTGVFRPVIRVFAAKINNSTFTPVSVGYAGRPFAGTQAGLTAADTPVGRILFDDAGLPVRRSNGEFFTSESGFFMNGSPVNAVRLESSITTATSNVSAAKFSVVKFTEFGHIDLANYDDVGSTVVAMLLENVTAGEAGALCMQGVVVNPMWNWSTVGVPLWVSSSGQLTNSDPHVSNPLVYTQSRVPVARVLSPTSVIFDQGLGGKGECGATGATGTTALATVSTAGITRLSTPPADANTPIAVGDNDPRLTVTVQKTGDTMTGLLVLSANPVAALGAATKQYVDTAVAAVGSGSALPQPIAYTSSIPFTGISYMPTQLVSDVISFTVNTTGAVEGGSVVLDLIADGVNVPTFTGFSQWGGSSGYANVFDVRNTITFWQRDGVRYYSIAQRSGLPAEGLQPIPPLQVLRASQLVNAVESGDGASGWNYTGTATGFNNYGRMDKVLQSGADGSVSFTVGHVVGGTLNTVVGFQTSPVATANVSDFAKAVWVHQTGILYRAESGVYTATSSAVAMGDIIRLRRVGTSMLIEQDVGGLGSFTTVYTYTGIPTDAMYVWFNLSNAGSTAYNFRGEGLV